MTRATCVLLLLSSTAALACWDAERVEWNSVLITVDHGHDTPTWSVSRAKELARSAANARVVPIWTVQVFASRTRDGAERALHAVEDFAPPGFYTVELHPGPTRQGEVRAKEKIFQSIAAAYANPEDAQRAVRVLRAQGFTSWARRE